MMQVRRVAVGCRSFGLGRAGEARLRLVWCGEVMQVGWGEVCPREVRCGRVRQVRLGVGWLRSVMQVNNLEKRYE